MTEQFYRELVVWTLLVSSIAQAVIHFTTAWALGPQPKEDAIGSTLRLRELSLGMKNALRTFFDIMLVVLVVSTSGLPFTADVRKVIYSALIVASVVAILSGAQFINALRRDNWGRPETKDDRDRRQDKRTLRQDIRDWKQDKRGEMQDKRGWEQSRQSIAQGDEWHDTDDREDALDVREHDLDEREDEGQPS